MHLVPVRRSERNKNKVANDERDRRRNTQWQDQQQRAQNVMSEDFVKEQEKPV